MMKPIVADLNEALGQDMLQEALQERENGQGHPGGLAGVGFSVAEGYGGVIVLEDGGVGERDAVNVTSEVFQGLVAAAHTLDVNHPVDAPDFIRDCRKGLGSAWAKPS